VPVRVCTGFIARPLIAALVLATEGIAVFSLKYRSKEPEGGSGGFYDATTNPATETSRAPCSP
jgi:hypothetical protein